MASAYSPWDKASEYFIDCLVSLLKRTRRWSRDGRLLRALNRHWCAALNRHVVEVRPYCGRKLSFEDIDSLLKFQNLTALNTIRFESEDDIHSETKCLKLAKILSQLPRLSRLEASEFFDFLENKDALKLTGITSLFVDHYKPQTWSNILHLPIEEMVVQSWEKYMESWVSKITTLKTLHISNAEYIYPEEMKDFVDYAKQLDTVSFNSFRSDLGEFLPQMTNLVSIAIYDGRLELFSDLPRLTSLSWTFNYCEDLDRGAFRQLVNRLKFLSLDYSGCSRGRKYCPIPDDLFAQSMALDSLELSVCSLRQGLIEDISHRHLTHLCLIYCETPGPLTCLGKLTTLKSLHICDLQYTYPTLEMQLTRLTRLQSLHFRMKRCWRSAELMKEIGCLPCLECLQIYDGDFSDVNSRPSDAFEALKNLHNLISLRVNVQMPTAAIEEFFNLKILTSLELLEVRSTIFKWEREEDFQEGIVALLKEKAPHLKLTLCI